MRTLVIANGDLWLYEGTGAVPRGITSKFATEVVERDERSRRHSSWKHAPREEQTGVIPAGALWGRGQHGGAMPPPRFLFACFGNDSDTIFYVMRIGTSTALLRWHVQEDREVRLFHKPGIRVLGLGFNSAERRLLIAVGRPDGTAHVEIHDEDGNLQGAVTDGDSVDAAPSLIPRAAGGNGTSLVYQSSGIARHREHGYVGGVGHATVCWLDYASGNLRTVVEDARYDYLAPKVALDGTLYMIRRPAEKPLHASAGAALLDVVLIPWRLFKALLGLLNIFSLIFGKEPLRSAGGPRTPELDQDVARTWLHGRMIDLSKGHDDPEHAGALVPASWVLVRMAPGGTPAEIARHVVDFALAGDGSVVFTNGYDVLHWRAGAEPLRIGRQTLVESLAAA